MRRRPAWILALAIAMAACGGGAGPKVTDAARDVGPRADAVVAADRALPDRAVPDHVAADTLLAVDAARSMAERHVGTCTCIVGDTCCSGTCTNLATDPRNCGRCGNVCPSSAPYCSAGTCSAAACSCASGETCCGPSCCAAGTICCGTSPGLPGYGVCSAGPCPG